MSGPHSFGCCCGNFVCQKDCIWGTDSDQGCCHNTETLLLWNERKAWSETQHYTTGGCEVCRTMSQNDMASVQSIYKYFDCFYRVEYAALADPVSLVDPMPSCEGAACLGPACGNPDCTSYGYGQSCCSDSFPDSGCLCHAWWGTPIGGLSQWRYDELVANPNTRWFGEMTCHKGGTALGGTDSLPKIYDSFLFVVYFERWWRIASEECGRTAIYVPGCTQGKGGSDCSGVAFQEDDLVPKYFIYACSGIPIYQWELDEALALEYIDSDDYDAIVNAMAAKQNPPQTALKKMARGGYFTGKDWREEQRQAFIDLDTAYPKAGYDAFIQDCVDMPRLGAFRKRCTNPTATSGNDILLHKDDVVPHLTTKQAAGMIEYPGTGDYDYWRERQWVYFSGKPAGWTWAGWDAFETGRTEIEAILDGVSRGAGLGGYEILEAPLLAFKGDPRPPNNCSNCGSGSCGSTCNACTNDCADNCGADPVVSCDPPTICQRFLIQPTCQGVHFVYQKYIWENTLDGECLLGGKFKCFQQSQSFLTKAWQDVGGWTTTCPNTCNSGYDGAFHVWDNIENATMGLEAMCNELLNPADPLNPVYTTASFCCGSFCEDFSTGCPSFPPNMECPDKTDCPPHSTSNQNKCIGHDIDCP